ncbi:MAG: 16S rRNA (cytidine(1402)-2'-O)-methyltransferase [Patescibacteria group bacterium]
MLYLVASPIGNLADISRRQATTLMSSDVILAEDTRSYRRLVDKIKEIYHVSPSPSQQVLSYYKEKEFELVPVVLDLLQEGKSISLVTDAGMPLISDPGSLLMKHVAKEGLSYTVVPGPSAVTTALLLSGFIFTEYLFIGFLPKKSGEVKKRIQAIQTAQDLFPGLVTVFFESPHRIDKTLSLFNELYPSGQIAICREMTKKFEEVSRGTASELLGRTYKGELTVVVGYSNL